MRPADLAAAAASRAVLRSGDAARRRAAAGVSAAEMARALGVTRQAVGAWESGVTTPTIAHALAYGRVLAALCGETSAA